VLPRRGLRAGTLREDRMTLRIDTIEIRQQPERSRYWAECQVMCDSGYKLKQITTPDSDGRAGILKAIADWMDGLDSLPAHLPPLVNAPPDLLREADDPVRIELRAQAKALGIEVDGRWHVARLRQEIADAVAAASREPQQREYALDAPE
jgi:hypothetical protein